MAKKPTFTSTLPIQRAATTVESAKFLREKDELALFETQELPVPLPSRKVEEKRTTMLPKDTKAMTCRFSAETKCRLHKAAWIRDMTETAFLNGLIDTYADEALTIEAEKLLRNEAKKRNVSVAELLNGLIFASIDTGEADE